MVPLGFHSFHLRRGGCHLREEEYCCGSNNKLEYSIFPEELEPDPLGLRPSQITIRLLIIMKIIIPE